MKKVRLNESQLKTIIKESLKSSLKEDAYSYDINPLDDEPVEDDWKSEEPSEGFVQSTLSKIEQLCNSCGATFRNMGDNEFGVIIKDKDVNNSLELIATLRGMKEHGIIYNTGGDISMGRAKFRIIKEINENKNKKQVVKINESQLKQIVMESVKRILKEYNNPSDKK